MHEAIKSKKISLLKYINRQLRYALGLGPEFGQWLRVVMNKETARQIGELPYRDFKVLEISGTSWKNFGFKDYKHVSYPDFDICNEKLDEKFDLIIAEQVFEHLLYPFRSAKNVYEMLNKEGYFLITTPFLVKIHNHPVDCTRWSPQGLKYFLAECGFELEKIQSNGWGNKKCVVANLKEKKWVKWNNKFHSLKNEDDFPVSVWALAQKQ